MSKRIVDEANFKVDSNKEELLALLDQIAEGVLTEWGFTAERYAKDKCPVDTGRLRNSITWALDGKGAAISNGCRYPGDPSGAPEEIYNCRCTLVAALDDVEYDSDRFTRLPAAVSYNDWKEHKYEKRNK